MALPLTTANYKMPQLGQQQILKQRDARAWSFPFRPVSRCKMKDRVLRYSRCPIATFSRLGYVLLSRVSVKKYMPKDKEQEDGHVTFEHPFPAHMMAIDGTWRRSCTLKEVSETSATLRVDGSIEGLALKEFFLRLSCLSSMRT